MAGLNTKRKNSSNNYPYPFTGQYMDRQEVKRLYDDFLRGRVSEREVIKSYEQITKTKRSRR